MAALTLFRAPYVGMAVRQNMEVDAAAFVIQEPGVVEGGGFSRQLEILRCFKSAVEDQVG